MGGAASCKRWSRLWILKHLQILWRLSLGMFLACHFFNVTPNFDAASLVADPEDSEAGDACGEPAETLQLLLVCALKAHCRENGVSLEIRSLFLGLPGKPFTLIT